MGYDAVRMRVKSEDRKVMASWLRAPTTAQALATRARIILASADGEPVRPMAKRLGVSVNTVNVWRRRYREQGLAGLRTRSRSGSPRQISDATERAVVAATMRRPKVTTHWSARRLAKEVKLSAASVHRIWRKYGLQPHRVETFKFSNDPAFDAKLADIVGLYLDPPERALVLCVDEKSQIQALNRTQPILPLRPGLPVRMMHDYERNGTTSLFAALEVASGAVSGSVESRRATLYVDQVRTPDSQEHQSCRSDLRDITLETDRDVGCGSCSFMPLRTLRKQRPCGSKRFQGRRSNLSVAG